MSGFNLSALAVREKAVTLYLLIAVVVAGLFAYLQLGRAEDPSFTLKVLTVTAAWPGATAREMQDLVAEPLEKRLQELDDYDHVDSFTRPGIANLTLQFKDSTPPAAVAELFYKAALRIAIASGLAPEARLRVTQLLFGPPVPYPVAFRVMGPDANVLRDIAGRVRDVMIAEPAVRDTNLDWGERTPAARINFDKTQLRLVGLDPKDAADQLQFLLSGIAVTQVREDIRTVQVVARTLDSQRLDPATIGNLALTTKDGRRVPLTQVGRLVIEAEDPIFKRRDREPVLTVRGDIDESLQPADVTKALLPELTAVISSLPDRYRIETAGSVEEAAKANVALVKVFPVMVLFMLTAIMIQVRSFRGLAMVFMTAPLGLVGAAPTLLLFGQPFGFNAILGLIGLAGILMRNTLILLGQIDADQKEGMTPRQALIEATVRRSRPVVLTAAAALLAFVPLTFSSFWGPMAFTLIGGVGVGTVLTILFLPALYALFFKIPRPDPSTAATR